MPSEIGECSPYLIQQINLIKPKIILALGKVAGKTLIKKDVMLKEMRNETYDFNSKFYDEEVFRIQNA